jgi:D-glycero-D-manno-heptose 1,7-bisphosphate phosphatase
MKRRAVILDRDGTLIHEAGYLDRLDRLKFFPYSTDAVRALNRAGLPVVVTTNQAGIGRGIVDESFVAKAHAYMAEYLALGGAQIDAWYYCPHHPDALRPEFRQRCDCRKPRPGMLQAAAVDMDLDLSRSFVVGDQWHDVQAGIAVGARALLVRTGYGRANEASPPSGVTPAGCVDNLIEAVTWILRHS